MERKNVAWNMIGSLVYAGSSMILTALVNHLIGTEQGGIFGFAFSTFGQQMFLVAYFGMRPLQSTDTSQSYTFSEYRLARFATCSMAVIFGICYIIFNTLSPSAGYTAQKALVVFLMVLYKVLDGFADVYESEFQRNGRLYLTGQAMAFRTLLSVFCFLGTLAVTRELVFSCVVAVLSQGAGILLFDKRMAESVPGMVFTRTPGRQWKLLQDSFLLFLSVFLDGLIFAMAKYAVDARMTSTDNAVFVAIFMPTSVINLAANFVIRPFLTRMSYQWEERNFVELGTGLKKLSGIIFLLTVIALAGAWAIGVPVLGAISNVELKPYKSGLLFIVLGGGFFAVMNLFYYVLVIMKKQKGIFFGYVPVCILSFFLSFWLVGVGGINGAAFSYMLEMLILMLCFMGQAIHIFITEERHSGIPLRPGNMDGAEVKERMERKK
ncbi:Membrane protein involved in the export of O-antigen and teichoic acid [Lacrimispora sphenoides]|jgi:O-antigen/teichoic acid export membrane protein|uniref:lipopolysaccharide biosynthesis protein n=1 Tax=Lacrimispora sphenoides TaxID=29370 RepID=UPI0008D5A068|nr:lipopolysaccharide biosynthesis protein [Lacrimispora sphenoides]SET89654.1 Membrane protein involved in the export of O-antigen and teichoic acid [Lacrimispora sphenoides]